jgi:hypothetical protein
MCRPLARPAGDGATAGGPWCGGAADGRFLDQKIKRGVSVCMGLLFACSRIEVPTTSRRLLEDRDEG